MTDGVDHINIYSQGATPLGRALSNFSDHAIATMDGEFASVEGYWYWLGVPDTEPRRDELRTLTGWEAKKLGRELRARETGFTSRFRMRIIHALTAKLICHPEILTGLRTSELPFRHYYVYDGKRVDAKDCQWLIDTWEFLRRIAKG